MVGYWKNFDVICDVFVEFDGKCFLCIGDFGQIDDEGYFFFVDCLKCMINVVGFKVWLVEVEVLLYQYFVIQEVCIVVVKDVKCGEIVKVFVVFKKDLVGKVSEQEIIDWLYVNMVVYKILCIVEFVEVLFKLGIGKVMWCELQEKENVCVIGI